jgi:hypothetical protein
MAFDPYYTWLGIPPAEQPPNHYRLLGLTPLEANPDAISHAADRQMSHVRSFQSGPNAAHSQRLLSEISKARLCLLDSQQKSRYDVKLRQSMAAPIVTAMPAPPPSTSPEPLAPPLPQFTAATTAATDSEEVESASLASPTRRREKNPLVEVAKVIGGGVAGIALSVLLLRYVFLMDITGLLPLPQDERASRTATVVPKYELPTSKAQNNASKPAADSPESTQRISSQTVAVEPTASSPPPETGDALPAQPQVPTPKTRKAKGKKGKAEPAKATTPQPAELVLLPVAPVLPDQRMPVPPAAEQAEAGRRIDEQFGLARVEQPEDMLRAADELHNAAQKSDASAVVRFVLLQKAAELAQQADDAQQMVRRIHALTQTFEIEPLPLEATMLEQFAASARSSEAIDSLVMAAQPTVQFAIREEEWDVARRLTDATLKACAQPNGLKHRKFVLDGQKYIADQQEEWEKYQRALSKLKEAPDDPAANLAAAIWLVESRADWNAALPYLSRSSRAPLKLAADLEQAHPTTAETRLAVADAWHDAGRAPNARPVWLVRALNWYGRVDQEKLSKPLATRFQTSLADLRSDTEVQSAAQRLASLTSRGRISRNLSQVARRHCTLLLTMEEGKCFDLEEQGMLADLSGKLNHGSLHGPAFVPGKVGMALSFDGKDDFVECADQPGLNPSQALTICAWVRPQSWLKLADSQDYLLSKDDWSRGSHGFVLRFAFGGQLDLTLGHAEGWAGVKTETRVPLDQWVHVAAIYDGRHEVVLLNGIEQGSRTFDQQITASRFLLRIGRGAYAEQRRFHGLIDEVAMFDIALTAADIQAIYELGVSGEQLAQ